MKLKIIAFIHLVLIVLVISSPFWLDWKLILVGFFLYYLQILLFGGCLLSQWQFENKEERFWSYFLSKFGIHPDKKKLDIFLDYILPAVILTVSVIRAILVSSRT